MHLQTPLSTVLRTTKDHVKALQDMGLTTVEDLLLYLPRAHEDLSASHTLRSAPINEKASLRGTLEGIKLVRTRTGKKFVSAKFIDPEGETAEVIWFNQPHIKRMLKEGEEITLTGKLVEKGYKLQIQSPTFEQGTTDLLHSGRLVPVYPQHEIISTKWLREKIAIVRDAARLIPETLPDEVLKDNNFLPRAQAIEAMHFPDDPEDVLRAQERFAFEELFSVQKQALQEKQEWQGTSQDRLETKMDVELIREFFASLKFTPTGSQKVAIYEILQDMEATVPMSRLLEGDVGSGKTLVATAVIANVIRNGGQCALMVPTEVLAKQHTQSIGNTLIQFHNFLIAKGKTGRCPKVELLTGSVTAGKAKEVKQNLLIGNIDLIIGTHALIEDSVEFKDLRLVIVDEQHRFGVAQRKRLQEKGSPHFLSMTATPIPRTLALTAFGHHDLSVLTEKPGNRKSIETKSVSPSDRKIVEHFIDHEIDQGRQVFVICPLISESSNEDFADIKSVENERKRLEEGFPSRRIAMLHGKMSSQEKDDIMKSFKERQFDILVSTSVIEVGIDVPNATIMIIEGAERFGLAQLHQFRGRVGRGEHKSYCFLFATNAGQARSARLRAMEQYDSGFQLAEIDLRLRGPGELLGFRQSGIPEVRAGLLMNPELVVRARRAAEKFLGIKNLTPLA